METVRDFVNGDRQGIITTTKDVNVTYYKIQLANERKSFQTILFTQDGLEFSEGNKYDSNIVSFSCKYNNISKFRVVSNQVLHIFSTNRTQPAVIWIDTLLKGEIINILKKHGAKQESKVLTKKTKFSSKSSFYAIIFFIIIMLLFIIGGVNNTNQIIAILVLLMPITILAYIIYWCIKKSENKNTYEIYSTVNDKKDLKANLQDKLKIVYNLAPSSSFSIIYNTIATKVLSATTYAATSTLNAEAKAIRDIKEKRENEIIKMDIQCCNTIETTLKRIQQWINDYERPDTIQAKLIELLDDKISNKSDDIKAKAYLPIISATDEFQKHYNAFFGMQDTAYANRRSFANQEYLNRRAEGLGFGIITNKVSNVALFMALDAHEKNKQLKQQENEIWAKSNYADKYNAEQFCSNILNLYENQYSVNIQSAIKKAFSYI